MLKTKPLVAHKFELMALAYIEERAKRIRKRRDELGLTQEQIAERMQDIHRERHPDAEPDQTRGQMVSDWERAVNEPSPPKLELLAAALEWTTGDLFAREPSTVSTPDPFASEDSDRLRRIETELAELRADLAALGVDLARDKAQEQKWRRRGRGEDTQAGSDD